MCGYLKTVLALLAIIMLAPQAFAADPGHLASPIAAGMFESGNYTFPDSLRIEKFKYSKQF